MRGWISLKTTRWSNRNIESIKVIRIHPLGIMIFFCCCQACDNFNLLVLPLEKFLNRESHSCLFIQLVAEPQPKAVFKDDFPGGSCVGSESGEFHSQRWLVFTTFFAHIQYLDWSNRCKFPITHAIYVIRAASHKRQKICINCAKKLAEGSSALIFGEILCYVMKRCILVWVGSLFLKVTRHHCIQLICLSRPFCCIWHSEPPDPYFLPSGPGCLRLCTLPNLVLPQQTTLTG